ncbi:MAG: CpXC domain-containing protein [Candidatus Omnitrophica bacterium]|nr:CpXC domain-containing protein [Candidatus Omnitrophota bacterium]
MSLQNKVSVNCPECGSAQEVRIWQSINVDLDPGLKEELFAGKVNVCQCPKCGYRAFLTAPLMYHDMSRRFVVQYYPPEILDEDDFIRDYMNRKNVMGEALPKGSEYVGDPHIVFV